MRTTTIMNSRGTEETNTRSIEITYPALRENVLRMHCSFGSTISHAIPVLVFPNVGLGGCLSRRYLFSTSSKFKSSFASIVHAASSMASSFGSAFDSPNSIGSKSYDVPFFLPFFLPPFFFPSESVVDSPYFGKPFFASGS